MSMENDLQDDALRRALAHAPDHAAAPHWRLRKAILERAHDAVAPASAAQEPEALPWWKRLAGLGGGSRRPWNAAFATVLVATLVVVLWQREPVPGAGPGGDARIAAQAPPAEAPAVFAPPAAIEPAPSAQSAPVAPSAPPAPVLEAPAAPAVPPPPPPAAAEPRPAPAAQPSPPAGLVAPGDAGAARAARPASPTVRTEATEPPTFAALSRWDRITIAQRGGASRSLSRAEARDLNALLGSAAITAVSGQPLAAAPEWRVSLERNGEVLAVFEVARGQVRWREGRTLPATGTPSAPALAALNEALRGAVQPAEPAAQRGTGQPPAAPR